MPLSATDAPAPPSTYNSCVMDERPEVEVTWLGRMEYARAWERQKEIVARRAQAPGPDRLLLLEHPPVYTLGRSALEDHLLWDEEERRRRGIALFHVDRGGDVTYHGPGQLVGYPLLDLKRLFRRQGHRRPDLHRYLRDVEEVIIQTLRSFEVRSRRYDGYTGVWVDTEQGPRKIAAIGVKVSSRGISSHGFALNVDPDLEHFAGIVPCGIREHGVASLAQLLGRQIAVTDVVAPLIDAFAQVFRLRPQVATPHF